MVMEHIIILQKPRAINWKEVLRIISQMENAPIICLKASHIQRIGAKENAPSWRNKDERKKQKVSRNKKVNSGFHR
jgi:hypothetical protein